MKDDKLLKIMPTTIAIFIKKMAEKHNLSIPVVMLVVLEMVGKVASETLSTEVIVAGWDQSIKLYDPENSLSNELYPNAPMGLIKLESEQFLNEYFRAKDNSPG